MHAGTVLACETPARADAPSTTPTTWRPRSSVTSPTPSRRQAAGNPSTGTTGRRDGEATVVTPERPVSVPAGPPPMPAARLPLGRMLAYSRREAQEIERDPVRARSLRRLGPHDARLRFRHHHRRREHPLRCPRSRSIARKSGLPLGFRGLPRSSFATAGSDADELSPGSNHTRSKSPWRSRPIRSELSNRANAGRSSPGSTGRPPTAQRA